MDLNNYQMSLLLFVLFAIPSLQQKDPHFLYGRSTIVHLFEWKWSDIAAECENFLAPHGYGGVQLSPIAENVVISNNNVNRPWWERYQTISYQFITRSGTEQELANMMKRCNQVGVRIFVDVIMNHMTADGGDQEKGEVGTGGSISHAIKRVYPAVPYEAKHFHPVCSIKDFRDPYQLRNCELVGLHDLNQSDEYVREKLVDKLNRMVDLGVAGFRLDAAKHMLPEDLQIIISRVKNLNTNHGFKDGARPFVYQEVSDFGGEMVTREDYFKVGAVTEFKYGNLLTKHFRDSSELKHLKTFGTSWGLMSRDDAVIFVDNHDTQRDGNVLTYKDDKRYKMAVAFMLAHPYGKIPRIMSSFDFKSKDDGPPQDQKQNIISPKINIDGSCASGWVCEHRWSQIYQLVDFRNIVDGTDLSNWWDNGSNQMAFCRGNKGFIVFNKNGDIKQNMQTCLPSGEYCDIISGKLRNGSCSGKKVIVDGNGNALIELHGFDPDGVLAIHIEAKISRSKI